MANKGPTAKTATAAPTTVGGGGRMLGIVCMTLLALQFGLQPILYKEFAAHATNTSVLVITCELCKFLVAFVVLAAGGELPAVARSWGLGQSLVASGLPACTYAAQNVLVQIAYQNLPPIVFNLINQTKLLWTALFVFVLIGKRFSWQQCVAMIILLAAAVLLALTKEPGSPDPAATPVASFERGIVPVVLASVLSGFGAAVTQRSMQLHQRPTALVTMELSLYGSLFLLASMAYTERFTPAAASPSTAATPSIFAIRSTDDALALFDGWDRWTLIPVLANALGGLLVGAVTKYVGGVLKSFALVCGIAFTAIVEAYVYGRVLPVEVGVAAVLVAVSMILYNAYPYVDGRAKPKQA